MLIKFYTWPLVAHPLSAQLPTQFPAFFSASLLSVPKWTIYSLSTAITLQRDGPTDSRKQLINLPIGKRLEAKASPSRRNRKPDVYHLHPNRYSLSLTFAKTHPFQSHMAQADTTIPNSSMTKLSLQTRRVSLGDLPSLPPIFNHTITNGVTSFRLEPIGIDFFEDILNATYAHDLPFFVATTLPPPASSDVEDDGVATVEKVIGYAYAMPWRPSYRAYRHTVEISIYIGPEYHSVGAGSALMDALMAALRMTRVRDPTNPEASTGGEGEIEDLMEKPDGTGRIREVLSIMSLDTEGRDGGYGLVNFYNKWGFEQIGQMKRVGYKFGRWIDVLILQVSL